jgi:membrane-associated phospholipid phosphatase
MISSATSNDNQAGLQLFLVLTTMAAASAVFHLNPAMDMAFSHYFFDGSQFPLRHNGVLQSFRQANFWAGGIIIAASMALVISRRLRKAIGINLGHALVPLITYGVGVGLIVNAVLKETFGRARPRDTFGLGGDHPLSAAWEFSGACASNCSFTSGEAAGAMAMMSALYLIPTQRRLTHRIVQPLFGAFAIALSFNRILFGGHYLSDVVLSVLIVAAVMLSAELVLRQVFVTTAREKSSVAIS